MTEPAAPGPPPTTGDADRRLRTLLDRLLARTDAGTLGWEETP